MGVDKYARVIRAYTRFCPQRPQRKKHGFPRTHAGSAAGGEESPWSALRPHTGGVSLPWLCPFRPSLLAILPASDLRGLAALQASPLQGRSAARDSTARGD
ncbi:hypothetical protein PCASD_23320 [Puccinia coronata f. sp. avenae]|uniref:Uncharacterized protein n=1 Tax=Puccinia coronata f. sp. avenae TaxID=200324 RepID=A0A2N5TKH3_9BASI|nr:hypothetical protein PCASD_23320 [Puccinia coronata f. sp. avenae]